VTTTLSGPALAAAAPSQRSAPAASAAAAAAEISIATNRPDGRYFYGQGITLTATVVGEGEVTWFVRRAGGSWTEQAGTTGDAGPQLKLPSSPVWDGASVYAALVTEDGRTAAVSEPTGLVVETKPSAYELTIAPTPDHVHTGETLELSLVEDPAQEGEHYHWYLRKPGEEFFTFLPGPDAPSVSFTVAPEHDGAEVIARMFDGDHAVIAESAPAVVSVDDHDDHVDEAHATRTTATLSRSTVTRGGPAAVLRARVLAVHDDVPTARGEDAEEVPEGRVVVRIGERRIASAPVDARGRARVALPSNLPTGRHSLVTAFVPADDHWEGSTADPVGLRVRR